MKSSARNSPPDGPERLDVLAILTSQERGNVEQEVMSRTPEQTLPDSLSNAALIQGITDFDAITIEAANTAGETPA